MIYLLRTKSVKAKKSYTLEINFIKTTQNYLWISKNVHNFISEIQKLLIIFCQKRLQNNVKRFSRTSSMKCTRTWLPWTSQTATTSSTPCCPRRSPRRLTLPSRWRNRCTCPTWAKDWVTPSTPTSCRRSATTPRQRRTPQTAKTCVFSRNTASTSTSSTSREIPRRLRPWITIYQILIVAEATTHSVPVTTRMSFRRRANGRNSTERKSMNFANAGKHIFGSRGESYRVLTKRTRGLSELSFIRDETLRKRGFWAGGEGEMLKSKIIGVILKLFS